MRLREGTNEVYVSPGKDVTLYQDGARTTGNIKDLDEYVLGS